MATDLRCVHQREFHSPVMVCSASWSSMQHSCSGCTMDDQQLMTHSYTGEKTSSFTSSVHLILTIPALFKLHILQLKHQCSRRSRSRRSRIRSIFKDKLRAQEENRMQKFSHSTHASLWVSLTRLDGLTTSYTNQVCLDLHIRPLVNLFRLAFYFLHCEIYI